VVPVPGAISSDQFNFWFVTARGNTVAVANPEQITVSAVVKGVGSIILNFDDFRYFTIIKSGSKYFLDNFPQGSNGYSVTIPKTAIAIAFRVKVTNLDPDQRNIIIDYPSVLFTLFPGTAQQPRGNYWYIVNVDTSNGNIQPSFTQIQLPYGQERYVYFASKAPMIFTYGEEPGPSKFDGISPVNLALFGTIGGSTPFGQNIPFVAINVYNYFNIVVNPSITLSPTSGSPGISVTVSGTGFAASSVITITFAGNPVATSPPTVQTDSSGSFLASFVVPSGTGNKQVTATDANGNSASASFHY
jgi:hypothetical protein